MLSLFVTAKLRRGQWKAKMKSWTLLGPNLGVILFGDEEGAAEVLRELGFRHEAAHAVEKGAGVGHADP